MKFVALLSGGKDSCYAMHLVANGFGSLDGSQKNELIAIANLKPVVSGIDTDSYMYQTVGQDVVPFQAKALNVPLYQRIIGGLPLNQQMDYPEPVYGDEVEDLFELLSEIKQNHPDIEAVSCGAIHSNYQRLRAENVCQRVSLRLLSPLWSCDQSKLLQEMIDAGIEAILIKTAAMGLDPRKHLGRSIKDMIGELQRLNEKFGLNVCGEGGEYETMTIGCPMFQGRKIVIDEWEKVVEQGTDVAYLKPIKMHLEDTEAI